MINVNYFIKILFLLRFRVTFTYPWLLLYSKKEKEKKTSTHILFSVHTKKLTTCRGETRDKDTARDAGGLKTGRWSGPFSTFSSSGGNYDNFKLLVFDCCNLCKKISLLWVITTEKKEAPETDNDPIFKLLSNPVHAVCAFM